MEELLFLKMSNIMKKQKKKGWTKDLIEKKKICVECLKLNSQIKIIIRFPENNENIPELIVDTKKDIFDLLTRFRHIKPRL